MALRCWLMRLILLCVWCSMDSYPVITADAQTLVITKASPVGDVVEGDTVQLRCDATELQSRHFIEWTRLVMSSHVALATNGTNVDPRFTLNIMFSSTESRIEFLVISEVRNVDATTYSCIVRDSKNMNNAVITHSVNLTVLYFPSAIYPICIPDGPVTVQEGTTVNMSCTTETGNPAVQMQILPNSASYTWTSSTFGNEQMMSLNVSVNATNQGFSYECKITSIRFPGMEGSCTMGPITITSFTSGSPTHSTTTLHQNTSAATEKTNSSPTETTSITITSNLTTDPSTDSFTRQPNSPTTDLPIAIIAGAAGAGGFLLLVVITLIVLYVCRCCCFNDKSCRSSLWLTDLPPNETVEDPNTGYDNDRSEPKMSTSVYQNAIDLMTENKPDLRMPPQSVPESSHLDTQEILNNDDEAADFISPQRFSIHSQNNDQDNPRSPGLSSFKLTRPDDCITDKEDGDHLGTVEPNKGDVPTYGVVKKSNLVSQGSKKKQPEITSDGPDPWAESSLNQHENINPAFTKTEYAEMSSLSDDPGHSRKPTATVRPVSHTPKPPIPTKPVLGHQSSRRTNTNQAPPSVAKKPIKKFKPKEKNPPADEFENRDETPLHSPVAPSVSRHPPSPPSPLIDHEGNASVEGYGEEGGDEVPPDTQVSHEARAVDDGDVMYAELDLQSAPSDAMPQPQEEQTVYASIMSK